VRGRAANPHSVGKPPWVYLLQPTPELWTQVGTPCGVGFCVMGLFRAAWFGTNVRRKAGLRSIEPVGCAAASRCSSSSGNCARQSLGVDVPCAPVQYGVALVGAMVALASQAGKHPVVPTSDRRTGAPRHPQRHPQLAASTVARLPAPRPPTPSIHHCPSACLPALHPCAASTTARAPASPPPRRC
jgi:hypothetical protein